MLDVAVAVAVLVDGSVSFVNTTQSLHSTSYALSSLSRITCTSVRLRNDLATSTSS